MILDGKIELNIELGGYGVALKVLEPIETDFYDFIGEDELDLLFTILQKRKELRK